MASLRLAAVPMTRTIAHLIALVAVIGAALATGVAAFASVDTRTIQLADGSIVVLEVLRPWVGKERIGGEAQ